jgi:hypothetical protein
MKRKKSWLTTLFGIIAAAAGILATSSTDPKTKEIATQVGLVSAGLVGINARDNKVSSEDAGAK